MGQPPLIQSDRFYCAPMGKRLLPFILIVPLIITVIAKGHLGSKTSSVVWIIAVLGLLWVVGSLVSAASAKITLLPDKLVKKTIFGAEEIAKNDILEIRRRTVGLVILVHARDFTKSLVIQKGIIGDADWDAWMAPIKGKEFLK